EAAENREQDEDQHDHPERDRSSGSRTPVEGGRAHALERHAACLRDASDNPLRAREQPRPVLTLAEERRHELAARLAGGAVRDPLLEVVADFDADLPLLQREHDEDAVVLALAADAAAVVLE